LALKGLGAKTKTASAMLIMAIAGGALLPAVYAQINTQFGGNSGVTLLFILYASILFYSSYGYKLTSWNIIPGKSVLYGREK
jgi:fucose permease